MNTTLHPFKRRDIPDVLSRRLNGHMAASLKRLQAVPSQKSRCGLLIAIHVTVHQRVNPYNI